ncbi:zinc ribbon domain-containing protein [Chloroflexota bacterium]
MPLYEYVCPRCGNRFELIRSSSRSGEEAVCPHCSNTAERVLSTFACFTRDSNGGSANIGGGSSCGACSAGSCSTCA